jgi:hypothetical protein
VLDRGEALVPEALQHPTGVRQAFGSRPVQPLRALPSLFDEPRFPKDTEVFRDGRTADIELRRDLAGRSLLRPDQPQDRCRRGSAMAFSTASLIFFEV